MIKLSKNQIVSCLVTLLFLFPVFTSSATYAAGIFKDGPEIISKTGLNLYFKYVKQDTSKFGKNDHPVELKQIDIINALKALEFEEKKFLQGKVIKLVFFQSQITQLGKQLSKGLKEAEPGQDIIFVMAGAQSKMLVLDEKTFVAGRAFYQEGKLNIIIGEYNLARNDAFESAYDPSGRGGVPYAFNHGQRSKISKKFKGHILNAPGIETKVVANRLRPDWFMLDVELASQAYLAKLNEIQNPSQKRDVNMEIEAAKLARERREMRLEMARMRKEMKEISSDSASKDTLEERIVVLEQLRKKELITQEEYDARRQAILNDI